MIFMEVLPALVVLCVGAALYVWVCLRFPPALVLGVVAYSMISKSASVAYLETVEIYIIEVAMTSRWVGATPRQIFYNLFIFIIALAIMRSIITRRRPAIAMRLAGFGTPGYNRELHLALIVSATLLGVQLLNAILSPPYAVPGFGVNRQQFWGNIRFPLIADIVGVLVIFVPAIAGVALAYGNVTNQLYFRRFSIMLMLAYGVFFLLTGARFNGSLMALLFWLSSYWTVLWVFGKSLYVGRMGLLVALAVSAFVAVGYTEIADRGISEITGSAWNGLLYRALALQGDIYFAADVMVSEGRRHSVALLLEDMTTTIWAYMPAELAEAYLYKGVNLAGSLPGNAILVFGHWLGLAPMAFYAISLGLVASAYTYMIISGRFMLVLPGAYLCLWAHGGYTQGSLSPFLSYKFALFVGLMILWLLSPQSIRRHRRPMQARIAHSTIANS